jgi:hypothetical protein
MPVNDSWDSSPRCSTRYGAQRSRRRVRPLISSLPVQVTAPAAMAKEANQAGTCLPCVAPIAVVETEAALVPRSLKVAELRRELRARGLRSQGLKAELIARLEEALLAETLTGEADAALPGISESEEVGHTAQEPSPVPGPGPPSPVCSWPARWKSASHPSPRSRKALRLRAQPPSRRVNLTAPGRKSLRYGRRGESEHRMESDQWCPCSPQMSASMGDDTGSPSQIIEPMVIEAEKGPFPLPEAPTAAELPQASSSFSAKKSVEPMEAAESAIEVSPVEANKDTTQRGGGITEVAFASGAGGSKRRSPGLILLFASQGGERAASSSVCPSPVASVKPAEVGGYSLGAQLFSPGPVLGRRQSKTTHRPSRSSTGTGPVVAQPPSSQSSDTSVASQTGSDSSQRTPSTATPAAPAGAKSLKEPSKTPVGTGIVVVDGTPEPSGPAFSAATSASSAQLASLPISSAPASDKTASAPDLTQAQAPAPAQPAPAAVPRSRRVSMVRPGPPPAPAPAKPQPQATDRRSSKVPTEAGGRQESSMASSVRGASPGRAEQEDQPKPAAASASKPVNLVSGLHSFTSLFKSAKAAQAEVPAAATKPEVCRSSSGALNTTSCLT